MSEIYDAAMLLGDIEQIVSDAGQNMTQEQILQILLKTVLRISNDGPSPADERLDELYAYLQGVRLYLKDIVERDDILLGTDGTGLAIPLYYYLETLVPQDVQAGWNDLEEEYEGKTVHKSIAHLSPERQLLALMATAWRAKDPRVKGFEQASEVQQ